MDWPAVVALCAAVGCLGGVVTKLVDYAVKTNKGESAAESVKTAHTRIDAVAKELGEFKTVVARDYASNRMIEQMEARLVVAINRLGDRLDGVFRPTKD